MPNTGRTYYWRVRAGNASRWGSPSASRRFVNGGSTTSTNRTLSVRSSGATSVPITSTVSTYAGTTNYTRSNIPNNRQITLTAPATRGSASFSRWTGCNSVSGRTCRVTMNANKTVTANYGSGSTGGSNTCAERCMNNRATNVIACVMLSPGPGATAAQIAACEQSAHSRFLSCIAGCP